MKKLLFGSSIRPKRRISPRPSFEKKTPGTINRIELEIEPRNFDVKVSLEGSENRLSWVSIQNDVRLVGISQFGGELQNTPPSISQIQTIDSFGCDSTMQAWKSKKPPCKSWKQEEGEYQIYELAKWDPKNDTDRKITEVRIELKDRYPVSRLQLELGSTRDFYRPAQISYLKQRVETEEGVREVWRDLASGTLTSMEDPDLFTTLRYTDALRLTIENHDNLPLNIRSVQVSGPVFELLAELEAGNEYVLAYGDPNASRPRYDLVHFQDRIPRDDLVPAGLGEELVLEDKVAEEQEKLEAEQRKKTWGNVLLWGVILLVVAVVGFVTVRMMRKAGKEKV